MNNDSGMPFAATIAIPLIKKAEMQDSNYRDNCCQGTMDDQDNGLNTYTDDPG